MDRAAQDGDDLGRIGAGHAANSLDSRLIGARRVFAVLAAEIPSVARLAAPGYRALFLGIGSRPGRMRRGRLFLVERGIPVVVDAAGRHGRPSLARRCRNPEDVIAVIFLVVAFRGVGRHRQGQRQQDGAEQRCEQSDIYANSETSHDIVSFISWRITNNPVFNFFYFVHRIALGTINHTNSTFILLEMIPLDGDGKTMAVAGPHATIGETGSKRQWRFPG